MAKRNASNRVESIKHKDKRKNIPTEELRDFVAEDENAPKTMLYPRDPSLDPQLVWKGKDEQDGQDLAVPVVPIYIQEKIHPQAILSQLPHIDHSGGQLDLFSDFNGLPAEFSDRVDFYHHEGNWSNRMILGDSLLVMTSLAEKEGLKGKVQTIYLDPPYGIKFGSNWQVSTRKRDVKDGKAEDATRQPEQVRAFRDTWKLGIHSYLAYLRDRLVVARDLLTETGSIFVQIGEDKCHISHVVADTDSWEQKLAQTLEDMDEVVRYVKNHNLGFTIPYSLAGEAKNYVPDFIACLDDGHGPDDLLNLLIEVTGEKKKDKAAKVSTARTLWVPAVNNHRAFGRWDFLEIDDPWNAMNSIRGVMKNG